MLTSTGIKSIGCIPIVIVVELIESLTRGRGVPFQNTNFIPVHTYEQLRNYETASARVMPANRVLLLRCFRG